MKFQILLIACVLICGNVLVQAQNSAATAAITAENQSIGTPAERERIKAVCLAESQAFFDLDYDAWAVHHLQSENDHLTWNNPDGSFGDQSGWQAISEDMESWFKIATKNAGKLSQFNHFFVIRGDFAYVNFNQTVTQPDGKTGKSKEHRVLLYDAKIHAWKIMVVNAFADHTVLK
ncbi:MAG: hypothetical protein IPN76_34055 [Saprospiraceae bacterium]|nr:hypothetical protein [Saprospiraceae bacterium]